jgi:hypothetical protein
MAESNFEPDVPTRIVNISWQHGLAVIFGEHDKDAAPFKPPSREVNELSGDAKRAVA